MLRIFASKDYLAPAAPYVAFLYPFWGPDAEDPNNPLTGRFDRYLAIARRCFTLTELRDADIAVYPEAWRPGADQTLARRLANEAMAAGKPMVVFSEHDSTAPVEIENSIVFRCSLDGSRRGTNEFALPAWSEDLLERYRGGRLVLREKQARPVVSYCGYAKLGVTSRRGALEFALGANPRVHRFVSALGYDLIRSPGPRVRTQAIHVLSRSRAVKPSFILRKEGYWSHVQRATGRVRNVAVAQQWRRDFVDNIIESDYVLCTRGYGNFSYRLYETLSCGRIPVFVDTECVLPYEHLVEWRRFVVWISEDELDRIDDRVAAFHEALSETEFQERQRACRRLWEEWLSPQGFFANFHKHFLPSPGLSAQHRGALVGAPGADRTAPPVPVE